MTPIRANIVGPSVSATRIRASIAACHSGASCSAFGSFRDVIAGILQRDKLAAAGQRDWFVEFARPALGGWHAFSREESWGMKSGNRFKARKMNPEVR